MIQTLRTWARGIKRELLALSLAYRDSRTPWYARVWAAFVLAYAFSPIDLTPDFIPVLGLLDDALLLPLGIALALRLMLAPMMADARVRAEAMEGQARPTRVTGAVVVVLLWLLLARLVGQAVWRHVRP
ncbi:membrane protein (plasmid) [Deinococcus aetherius]|uniref:Membrane protein n=1 Tax=Deinococcus aetherius TaxID=200252 RepID=A0ABN6RP41_9DEIO|nr:DUF1232 domain-containing protein [Deinococcus aetherius]BDP44628.1 membrane protein [Deinococcus aetherius]